MGYSAMVPQECPTIAKEERDEISVRDICGYYANRRRIGRQPIKTSFGCSQADQRMRKIVHSEKVRMANRAVRGVEVIARDASDQSSAIPALLRARRKIPELVSRPYLWLSGPCPPC